MKAQIRNLAQLMRAKRDTGERFVLMLGAGASMSSGVPATPRIMEKLVETYGQDLEGDLEVRFDELWRRSSEDDRRMFLEPYLDQSPSPGYARLAALVAAGYFDLILTFNFDDLVEKALKATGFTDYKVVIRGETALDKISRLVDKPQAALTLLKLHGSLFSTDTFLFDKDEMLAYPPEIEELLARITRRDIIICGYGFNDLCVMKAFSAEGNSIFCVNPSGIPSPLRGFMVRRRSVERVIDGELGYFDTFLEELHGEAENGAGEAREEVAQRCNPFKFLDSYETRDKDWFFGRHRLVERTLERLAEDPPPKVLHFAGTRKSGKTSFVRAGLMAHLDSERFEPVYVRCRGPLERALLAQAGGRWGLDPASATVADLVAKIEQGEGKHVLLILDQFENALHGESEDEGHKRLTGLLETLCGGHSGKLTVVIVTVDDKDFYKLLLTSKLERDCTKVEEVESLSHDEVRVVLRLLARKGRITLDNRIIKRLEERYRERRDSRQPFTLAHLQAICYLAVRDGALEKEKFDRLLGNELESALDLAINECDIMNFVEDLPIPEERLLVRHLMKVVSPPSKRVIATFLRDRFGDLAKRDPFPEPL